ncbi:hypothetical protein ABT061_15855 [Streptosporangium sp. NPDC002544]|uniref:hypothetical protein n=1 Tax=Streptosporangium sp. NPDC002544 TaxID=3154538 RepID=UPI0033168A02
MDPAIVVGLVGGIFGLASTVYTARQARRASQDRAEQDARAARVAAEESAYRRATEFDTATQARMQAEIARQADQIRVLQRQVTRLTRQLTKAGLAPETTEEDSLA